MGKKGGGFFQGFKPQLSSSSRAFARRGDPWVTDREGKRDFGRQVEIENPDMDADRQRNERIKSFSKEFQDRVKRDFDYKMTMQEAIDTEKSIRMDSYHAKAPLRKPERGKWPEKGRDFRVDTIQRKCVNVALKLKADLKAMEPRDNKHKEAVRISCPRKRTGDPLSVKDCSFSALDSRLVSRHIREHPNGCCTHKTGCNCPDCRMSRNDG